MNFQGTVKELIKKLMEYDMNKLYSIEIKEVKSKRSLEQNKLLWKLIHIIAKETKQDDYEVYCALLEEADALSDYIITQQEMEKELKKCFRGVKFIRMQQVNTKECYVYKVYIGSSKMNTKEMNELIDTTMQIADELGVNYEQVYYE